tara:strand:+ start:2101 stop:3018 length:918 start_codon:yes stop_codon:yes gene_type:complete
MNSYSATVCIATSSFSHKSILKIKNRGLKILVNDTGKRISKKFLLKHKQDINIIIAGTEMYDKDLLSQLKNLKHIIRFGSGIDNIDINYINLRKIKLFRTSTPKIPVAELALSLILTSLRKTNILDNVIKQKNWSKIIGNNLYKKKIGVVGLGTIGRQLLKLLKPFNNEIFYFDKFINKEKFYGQRVHKSSLKKIFKNCDIISLHLPLNKHTYGIISKDVLFEITSPVVLVNTSRAELIDLKQLKQEIIKKRIFFATDVYEKEPYSGDLIKYKNTNLSPHIGSYTIEEREKMEKECIDKLDKIIR